MTELELDRQYELEMQTFMRAHGLVRSCDGRELMNPKNGRRASWEALRSPEAQRHLLENPT
jgi:hypothetical protein